MVKLKFYLAKFGDYRVLERQVCGKNDDFCFGRGQDFGSYILIVQAANTMHSFKKLITAMVDSPRPPRIIASPRPHQSNHSGPSSAPSGSFSSFVGCGAPERKAPNLPNSSERAQISTSRASQFSERAPVQENPEFSVPSSDLDGLLRYLRSLGELNLRITEAVYSVNSWMLYGFIPLRHHGFILFTEARTMHSLTNVLKRASRTKPIPEEEEDGGLRRCLKTRDVVGLGMGVTVGAGVFMATGKASEEAGPAVVIALLIAAFGCGCTGLCYAEMANLAPSTGSSYSFVYHSAGELPACMVGLTNIINNVMTGAAVSRGWEGYLRALLVTVGAPVPQFLEGFAFGPFEDRGGSGGPGAEGTGAPLLLGFVIAINLCGTLAVSTFNNVVTVGRLAMHGKSMLSQNERGAILGPSRWKDDSSVFFSYIGFDVLATLSTEATHSRVIPLGIVLTLALSTCLYCCVGGVFTGLIKYTDISKTAPLASAAELRGLRWLALLVAIGALGNTLTTVIGCVLAQPRLNSYTFYWNLPQSVSSMAESQQITLTTSQSTGSGVALVHHWKGERDLKTLEMLRDGNFDAVVLQEHSMRSLDEPECMMTHGKLLAEAIKKKKAKVFIFLTWARESWICRKVHCY
eukprot:g27982.t1